MEMSGNSFVEIDTEQIVANFNKVRGHVGGAVKIMPVVKANAYGHGLAEMTRLLTDRCGIDLVGVGQVIEAKHLIETKLSALPDMMVLGAVPTNNLPYAIAHDLILPVFRPEGVYTIARECARQKKTARVHIKVDTGLGRIGARVGEELGAVLAALSQSPAVQTEGVYTHFSDAAADDVSYTQRQLALFRQALGQLAGAGISPKYVHAADTGALIHFPATHYNMVRTGLGWLGYDLHHGTDSPLGIRPAIRWRAYLTNLHPAEAGSSVGYAQSLHLFSFSRPSTVALASIGSGDGFPRELGGGKGWVLIHGKRAPVIQVCMDQTFLDVTNIPESAVGDEVVLLGRDGESEVTVFDWKASSGLSVPGALSAISDRPVRVYL